MRQSGETHRDGRILHRGGHREPWEGRRRLGSFLCQEFQSAGCCGRGLAVGQVAVQTGDQQRGGSRNSDGKPAMVVGIECNKFSDRVVNQGWFQPRVIRAVDLA